MTSISSNLSFSAGGIDVSSIVSSLMDVESQPLVRLQTRQSTVQTQLKALQAVQADIDALRLHATGLVSGSVSKFAVTSSSTAASAVVSGTGAAGSVTFTVAQLAQAHGVRTASTVVAPTALVTTDALLAISTTTAPLGIATTRAGAGLGAGTLQVAVTQATTGATRTGTAAPAASTVVDGTNQTLQVEVDGVARTATIAAGTYDRAGLAAAVSSALSAAGAATTASLDGSGRVVLTTAHEGSAATLEVTGGTALTALGLAVDTTAATGTDGKISINGTVTTVTSAGAGIAVSAGTGAGALSLGLGGGLRVGTSTVAVVSTGDGSLASVVAAVNGAKIGASAAAVRTGTDAYVLQLSSGATGLANALSVDTAAFASVGGLVQTSAAADARITIGTGPGAYAITGSGNTFDGVIPGVSITAKEVTSAPVTVSSTRDDSAVADGVQKLVTLANAVLTEIAKQTKYDPSTRSRSPLTGESLVRRLATDLRAAVSDVVTGAGVDLASKIGIVTQRDGTFSFDRAAFTKALAADPTGVERLLGRGGTGTGGLTFADASDLTAAGTYAIQITTAATRATSGAVLVGGSATARQIAVRQGTTTVTYDVAAGATAADIAGGLRSALAAAHLDITAEVDSGGVRLRSVAYGAAASFDFDLDHVGAPAWTAATGVDVVGTIDGQAAIGQGQRLRLLDLSTSSAKGLQVDVPEGVTGAVGSVTYQPGIAQRLSTLATRMTGTKGALVTTGDGYQQRIDGFADQIAKFQDRLDRTRTNLLRQWSSIQSTLNSLQSQGSWLQAQTAKQSG